MVHTRFIAVIIYVQQHLFVIGSYNGAFDLVIALQCNYILNVSFVFYTYRRCFFLYEYLQFVVAFV